MRWCRRSTSGYRASAQVSPARRPRQPNPRTEPRAARNQHATRDQRFQRTINEADLAVPDGMPLIWLSRLKGQSLTERVTGVDLVDECCKLAAETNQGVFLLGAGPGIAERAAEELEARHAGLRIVGTYSPPMASLDARENQRIARLVREAAPGFLFVALGAPRPDLWIREH